MKALDDLISRTVAGMVLGGTWGIFISIPQWIVLRSKISGASWWIPASFVGFSFFGGLNTFIPTLLFAATRNNFIVLLALVFILPTAGIMIGILQWLVLNGKVRRAGWWIMLAWLRQQIDGLFFFSYVFTDPLLQSLSDNVMLVIGSLSASIQGLVIGILTGIPLTWLLQHRK